MQLTTSPRALVLVATILATFPIWVACDRTGDTATGDQSGVSAAALLAFKQGSPSIIAGYVETEPVKRLQIGAGSSRRPGWLNTDIEPGEGLVAYLDASKRFPLDDGTFHYVASEHVIEHLTFDEAHVMIAESYRVLAPGGKMRVATPNLLRFVELFQKDKSAEALRYIEGKLAWHSWPHTPTAEATILNLQMTSWGHKFLFDPETLRALLERAGFTSIQEFAVSQSDDNNLRGIEARDSGSNAHLNAYETMVFQAVKPSQSTSGAVPR